MMIMNNLYDSGFQNAFPFSSNTKSNICANIIVNRRIKKYTLKTTILEQWIFLNNGNICGS